MGAMKTILRIFAVTICVLSGFISYAQSSHTVTGTVKDASGQPIIGAAVMVEGFSASGSVTDMDGKYKDEYLVIGSLPHAIAKTRKKCDAHAFFSNFKDGV